MKVQGSTHTRAMIAAALLHLQYHVSGMGVGGPLGTRAFSEYDIDIFEDTSAASMQFVLLQKEIFWYNKFNATGVTTFSDGQDMRAATSTLSVDKQIPDMINAIQSNSSVTRSTKPSALSCATAAQLERANYWLSSGDPICAPEIADQRTKGWEASVLLMFGKPAWHDPKLTTVDGVHPIDAAICSASGLIDLPNKEALLANFTAVEEMSSRVCSSGAVQTTINNTPPSELSAVLDVMSAKLDAQRKLPLQRRTELMSEDMLLRQTAYQCSMGTYPCMIRFCSYNFCRLQSGSIATACQCGDAWDVLAVPQ